MKTVHRYYRCSTHDKHGPDACPGAPLPARAIEDYVAERLAEIAQGDDFVQGAHRALEKLREQRQKLLEQKRRHLVERVGEASARAGKLADAWVEATGSLRETLSTQLAAAHQDLERQQVALEEAQRHAEALESRRVDIEWVTRAMGNFGAV